MTLLNQHTLIGYIQTDTTIKTGQSGKKYINLLLNIEDHYKRKGEFIKNYQSVPMVAFGKVAEQVSERTIKGQKVLFQFKIVSQISKEEDSQWVLPQLIIQRFETLESKEHTTERASKKNKQEKVEISEETLETSKTIENDIPEELNPLNNYHIGYQLREFDYR